ncbi:MAG: pyruvate, phosphate dikinase, partial [Gammaproteobacteria bacterium HGW-Gammaproteobacteria-14]
PRRPDLDHIVVEGGEGDAPLERLILHRDGALAWASEDADLLLSIKPHLAALASAIHKQYLHAMAAEWVWDGAALWVIQMLPIGTLSSPREAWTRRASAGFSPQVITPLWYTLQGRWLKASFWRPLGVRAGWPHLSNIEPYRRQHSYLYSNSAFFTALEEWRGCGLQQAALPPVWRRSRAGSRGSGPVRQWLWRWRLRQLEGQLARAKNGESSRKIETKKAASENQDLSALWLRLMHFDRIGESLAELDGWLHYVELPTVGASGGVLEGGHRESAGISPDNARLVAGLAQVARGTIRIADVVAEHPNAAAGCDPVWVRWQEGDSDIERLGSLLAGLAPERIERMAAVEVITEAPQSLGFRARALRAELASAIREVLQAMAHVLHDTGYLAHPDDIFFLYFDELWQCWHQQVMPRHRDKLAKRKVRYLTDAHSGPPDWIIDQIGYGASAFGEENRQPVVQGYPLVAGGHRGVLRRIGSGWQLNQIEPGDILVLDECDTGWLPWLCVAGALVLAHKDPLDPAVSLAKALAIPTIWGVDDAMHCVADGDVMEIDANQGRLLP